MMHPNTKFEEKKIKKCGLQTMPETNQNMTFNPIKDGTLEAASPKTIDM